MLHLKEAGQSTTLSASHLLVAAGRKPRSQGLGLEAAEIRCTKKGVEVDAHLRTSNRAVFAAGDVVDGPHFTHVCSYHAGIVIRNALLHLPASLDYRALPWVTYTEPELAQVGLSEDQARKQVKHAVKVLRVPFADNDRAQAEGSTQGLIKVMADAHGRVLGASILGVHAGELAAFWALAITQRLKLKDIAGLILPYPTRGEIAKAVAA